MGAWIVQQIEQRIGPQDPARRGRYYSVLGVLGTLLAIGLGVRWLMDSR